MQKYLVTISKTISVLADDEYEAEEQAKADFDCTDLEYEVEEEAQANKQKGTSEMKKYLPIKIKDVEHLVNSYEKWYGTFDKDGYKYVIEQLNFDDIYYNDILSSLHNFKKGGEFYLIERDKRG